MKTAVVVLFIAHGVLHLLGFAKAFELAELAQLAHPIGPSLGTVWLLVAIALLVSAALFVNAASVWALVAAPTLVLSQILLVTSWSDARFGTIANVLLAMPVTLALLDRRSSSFPARYHRDVAQHVTAAAAEQVVTEADLATLPPLVQRYLHRAGAVGKAHVRNVHTHWRAQMKRTTTSAWMNAVADQYDFFDDPARLFLMDASLYGLPFRALHRYVGAAATMQVRAASMVDMVDARGPEMNRSETVTLFNDLCLLAPAVLVNANVRWAAGDDHSVRASFTNAGNTIEALLVFDDAGDLVNFRSDDRSMSADGKTYERLPWSTPVRDYRDYEGRRVASHGDAVWKRADGDYVYGRFDLADIRYNVTP